MAKYRKKPVVIEAWQWNGEGYPEPPEVPTWPKWVYFGTQLLIEGDKSYLRVPTLEGEMKATPGDWIIKGVKGEIYPCKPDIFEMTYEEVVDD